jgi:dihydrofolate synthase/folylpolyglutamate synthase
MLDGAHNEHATRALVSSLDSMESREKIGAVVLAIMSDKDIPPILRALAALRATVHCAELPMERCAGAGELAKMARAEGLRVGGVHSSPEDALDAARRDLKDGEMILCCGSLYLVGYVRKFLLYG